MCACSGDSRAQALRASKQQATVERGFIVGPPEKKVCQRVASLSDPGTSGVAERHGYSVTISGVGAEDPEVGAPSQLAVFVQEPGR